jgi:hypothetical protein
VNIRALLPIALAVALAGCTDEVNEPAGGAASSYPPMTLACAPPEGEPPVLLESAMLERIGDDLRLTWTASGVPPATGGYSANLYSADGESEYMVTVEFVDGQTPSAGTTGVNVVWAEPSKVYTATYPLSAMPEIGSTFRWSAALATGEGEGWFSQCPVGGEPVTYP